MKVRVGSSTKATWKVDMGGGHGVKSLICEEF
jgi:hypothetical protein